MFNPTYSISPRLLANVRRIALTTPEINRLKLPPAEAKRMQVKADALAAYGAMRISGATVSVEDVERLLTRPPARMRDEERGAVNYAKALQHIHRLSARGKPRLTRKLLLEIHRLCMSGLLSPALCGAYRKSDAIVTSALDGLLPYIPVEAAEVPKLVRPLLEWVDKMRDGMDPLILAGIFYRELMFIHPFEEGNKRTARLLTRLFLADLGIDALPWLAFERHEAANSFRYHEQLAAYAYYFDEADHADFSDWLDDFSDAITDSLLVLEDKLRGWTIGPDTRLGKHHEWILSHIDTHGYVTDRDYAKATDRSRPTRALDFRKLIALGLIARHGSGKNTHYKRG